MPRSMAPAELIHQLYEMCGHTVNTIGSAVPRRLALALDEYRGRSELLDERMARFDAARQALEGRRMRGYLGRAEWEELVASAPPVALALRPLVPASASRVDA
jgi:hypothetical protein